MNQRFDQFIERILKHEGGYVNHPSDPGGETKYGISKRTYPREDIKNLSIKRAKELYKRDFYDPLKIDQISHETLALHVFDFGVNAGIKRAVLSLQKIVGVKKDGVLGGITLATVNQLQGESLALQYQLERIRFYTSLANKKESFRVFLLGWVKRVLNT